MERRQLLLVDAFADEPTGGRPIAVDPTGSLGETQTRRVASELGVSGVFSAGQDGLAYTDCDGSQAVVSAAVAGYAGLYNHGTLESGQSELAVTGNVSPNGAFSVELDEEGTVTVDIPTATPEDPGVDQKDIASAIGVDVATIEDIGADLPIARVDSFGGTLLVPVNFLQHLSGATPSLGALATLFEETGVQRLVAFTFDTLEGHTDVHARVFDPTARGLERPASGVGVAACTAQLAAHSVFDGERAEIAVECGRFLDRPGTIYATVEAQPQVGGGALTTLDTELAVPAEDDDEIIEL